MNKKILGKAQKVIRQLHELLVAMAEDLTADTDFLFPEGKELVINNPFPDYPFPFIKVRAVKSSGIYGTFYTDIEQPLHPGIEPVDDEANNMDLEVELDFRDLYEEDLADLLAVLYDNLEDEEEEEDSGGTREAGGTPNENEDEYKDII